MEELLVLVWYLLDPRTIGRGLVTAVTLGRVAVEDDAAFAVGLAAAIVVAVVLVAGGVGAWLFWLP